MNIYNFMTSFYIFGMLVVIALLLIVFIAKKKD